VAILQKFDGKEMKRMYDDCDETLSSSWVQKSGHVKMKAAILADTLPRDLMQTFSPLYARPCKRSQAPSS
jgi:hypothetical protein